MSHMILVCHIWCDNNEWAWVKSPKRSTESTVHNVGGTTYKALWKRQVSFLIHPHIHISSSSLFNTIIYSSSTRFVTNGPTFSEFFFFNNFFLLQIWRICHRSRSSSRRKTSLQLHFQDCRRWQGHNLDDDWSSTMVMTIGDSDGISLLQYGGESSPGNWNGMLGEVQREEADFCIADISITSSRFASARPSFLWSLYFHWQFVFDTMPLNDIVSKQIR